MFLLIKAGFYFTPKRLWSVAVLVSVCRSVHSDNSENDIFKFHKIFCSCYPWSWLSPPLTTMKYILVLWTTSCFWTVRQIHTRAWSCDLANYSPQFARCQDEVCYSRVCCVTVNLCVFVYLLFAITVSPVVISSATVHMKIPVSTYFGKEHWDINGIEYFYEANVSGHQTNIMSMHQKTVF